MTRYRLLGGFAALFVGVWSFLPLVRASAAGEVIAVGWWTRLPTASAPEGGANVGSAPDGPNSVAAVRVDVGAGLSSLTLTAREAGGVPDTASIRVCVASDEWTAAEGGALEDAPDFDCAAAESFERGDDGVWTADVSALVAGRTGTVSLGLVADGPGDDNPLGVAPSEVQYERPTATGTPVASTTTTSAPTPSTTSAPPTTRLVPPTTQFVSPSPQTTDPTTDTTVLEIRRPTTTTTIPIAEERALPAVTDAGVADDGRPVQEAVFLVFIAAGVGLGVGGVSKWLESRA